MNIVVGACGRIREEIWVVKIWCLLQKNLFVKILTTQIREVTCVFSKLDIDVTFILKIVFFWDWRCSEIIYKTQQI